MERSMRRSGQPRNIADESPRIGRERDRSNDGLLLEGIVRGTIATVVVVGVLAVPVALGFVALALSQIAEVMSR
jgi:hypothetical protein